MTISEWVAGLQTDENGEVILETFADGGKVTISPANLVTLLSGVSSVPPTYAELSAFPIATSGGWKLYFDNWKSQGIVS